MGRLAKSVSITALGVAISMATGARAQDTSGPGPQAASDAPSHGSTVGAEATDAAAGLGDIIVTARKVAENLQSVPVAVTAFSGEALKQQNARNVADIANLTPGLVIRTSLQAGSAPYIQLRGQVQTDILATLDPSVGVYVDGYYWARAYGLNADLLDIQSVQTLKGPQGTLFGRNTTGGAIVIQTNDPQFGGVSGLVSGTYGRFNQASGTAVLNFPIVEDKLAVRLAFQKNKRDGYIDDPAIGEKLDNVDSWTGRAKLLYKPTETLSILLSGEWFKTDILSNPFRSAYVSPTSRANLQAAVESGFGTAASCTANAAATAACLAQGYALFSASIPQQASSDVVSTPLPPISRAKTHTYMATITLDTSFGAIKAIGGYRKINNLSYFLEGSPYSINFAHMFSHLSQYSEELQITGKAFDGAVEFAAGLFDFHEKGSDDGIIVTTPALNPVNSNFIADVKNKSQGIYAQVNYHITDSLSLTGGLRYSVDHKGIVSGNGSYNMGTFFGPLPGATFTCSYPTCPATRKDSFHGISYTAGLDYKVMPDILIYAKTARGFRSGGENLRAANTLTLIPFKPEVATSYEGGVKSEFFDRHLRVNLAGYYTIITGIQRVTSVFDSASGRVFNNLGNAGRADFYGGEAEVQALLFDGFRIDGSAAYTRPKYQDYVDKVTGFDRSREPFALVPRWTFSVSPSFEHDFDFGRLTLRSDVIYTSKMTLRAQGYYVDSAGVTRDASNGGVVTAADAAGITNAVTAKAATIINGRAALSLLDDKLEVAVFGKNLTDNRGKVGAANFGGALTMAFVFLHEPRTFGLSAAYKFGGH